MLVSETVELFFIFRVFVVVCGDCMVVVYFVFVVQYFL